MDKVVFLHLEDADDIIISLSCEENSELGIEGLTIQRNRKLELLLIPEERGACIEWEESDDIRVLLDEVILNRNELKFKTKGKVREYHFDVEDLSDREYEDLTEHFHRINFDGSINIHIA
jgi:hypothetical protein